MLRQLATHAYICWRFAVTEEFTARYERQDNQLWRAQIEEEPSVHVAARSLKGARTGIRDALQRYLGEEQIEPADSFELSETAAAAVERATRTREAADIAIADAAQAAAEAATALLDDGMSLRDAAEVLGLSHTRVQQLVRFPHDQEGA